MTSNTPESRASIWNPNRQTNKLIERVVKWIFGAFAFISILTTLGIILSLIFETIAFFIELQQLDGKQIWDFFFDGRWTPLFRSQGFGIFVLISATIMTSGIAILVALPIGLLAAIYLSEYANAKVRKVVKPVLEVLAGIPSVVFGYFALLFVTPLLRSFMPFVEPFNALSAGLVLGIFIMPLIASLSEDAIYSVPQSVRDGSYALGATKRETVLSVVLPAALSGIVASVILGVSRAIGETMVVTLAAGQNPRLGFNPFVSVQTMTSYIVQVSLGDTPAGTIEYKTLFAVGMTLFAITLSLNIFSFWFVRRFREEYE
ncbi:phosphate ABC transporter permease subunit PstC [Geitlerinema sp. PCC 9228]|jgi:phosphate transport system permease protein|uniref:phosphate ABC transporter permease subunit PstC n=1 Tax=Geitlerinema sp. PCC 9228 TaxID=111611 RepID=UPI0008F98D95|nr:phosphate ABC transporter permease subunit PstC [Geitlerinema sp. PCC 9228]